MSDELNLTPELTLTPETATAAAQAPAAPSLTLDTSADTAQAAAEAAQKDRDANAVKVDESMLTEAERKMVDEFSQKIDITDSNLVLQYGAAAQKNVAAFSENALNNVKTKDLGEVGEALSSLVVELKNFGQQPEKKGIAGFFQKKKNDLEAMKAIGRSDIFLKLEMIKKVLEVSILVISVFINVYAIAIGSVAAIGEEIPWQELSLLHLAYLLLQIEIAGICFGISAFLRRGGLGLGLGFAAIMYFLNIIANISDSAEFLKYITPFGYAEGSDIVAELSIDWKLAAIGMAYCIIGIAVGYVKYFKKDIA